MLMRSFAIAAVTAVSFATGFQAQAANETLNFTVTRDGSEIGTHSVAINTDGANTQVEVNTDIEVKVLFVTAYQFKHKSKEVWNAGQLVSLNSTTNDDGTDKALNVKAENGKITADSTVQGQERRQHADATTLPASLWNPATVKQAALLNTLDGVLMKIQVEDKGMEDVTASGSSVSARRYSLTGELTRDLWFDAKGRLVRVQFPDKTNSEIVYALD